MSNIYTIHTNITQKLIKHPQVLLGQVGVLLLVSFNNLYQLLKARLISGHLGIDGGDQSKCSFTRIIQRREVSEGCLHLFVV